MVCSSSADKMKQYSDTFLKDKASWTQQPSQMFPKELMDEASAERTHLSKPLMVVDKTDFHAGGTWFKPTTLEELLALLSEFGGTGTGASKIVVGNTEVGIGMSCRNVESGWVFYQRMKVSGPLTHSILYSFLQCRNSLQACRLSSSYPSVRKD
jgi:hypothetical protein